MRVLVTGATGLVGQRLCLELLRKNHSLVVVGRGPEESFRERFTLPCEYHSWDQLNKLSAIDAVFHLAGDNIASSRWTEEKKKRILSSRTETTQKLIDAFFETGEWPKAFISASAIGYYGDRGDEFLTEGSAAGSGFLSEVCQSWEASLDPLAENSRVVRLRLGVVLDSQGGFLQPMENLFSSGLGGVVGFGKQWMSWIHAEDLIQIMLFAFENTEIKGTYNAVAPESVTNKQWTKAYAEQLKVKAFLPAPTFALKLMLGEMSQLALNSQRVSAQKIQEAGFEFQFQTLQAALKDLYNWKKSPSERLFAANQWLSSERDQVFPFFSEAKNLEKITPTWVGFKVLNQSTENIQEGTLIDYKISVKKIPLRWRTQIQKWDPPHSFVDDQLKGPYKKWYHEHSFQDISKGTLMQDRVVYSLPMGCLGLAVAGSFVQKDISKIFNYRKKIIKKLQKEWS